MGTYTAYQMLKHQFNSYYVYDSKKQFSKMEFGYEGSRNLYFIVAEELLLEQKDMEEILEYVSKGNRLFIASSYLDEKLLDTLHIKPKYNGNFLLMSLDVKNADEMRRTSIQMKDSTLPGNKQYGFFYYPLLDYFKNFDSSATTILGLTERNKPNFIAVKYGDGLLYLHLHPEAFSNYFLLKEKNHEYFEKVLSYMNSDRKRVYWDDYYRRGLYPERSFSSFQVFMKYPPLKWALLISIFALLLFVLMGIKRRQRVIPVTIPNVNSSVSFAETIGRLYLQKKDHHNIVHKMVTYFLEKIRTKYYLNTSTINAEFISSLSRKSGLPETDVKSTFQYIQQLQEASKISDAELMELHYRLLPFFKT
mgnify:CR=1 FL=1